MTDLNHMYDVDFFTPTTDNRRTLMVGNNQKGETQMTRDQEHRHMSRRQRDLFKKHRLDRYANSMD